METKINIAKILKNKPEGTKLWTDMFGSVTLYVVTDACDAYPIATYSNDELKILKNLLEKVLCEVNEYIKD